MGAWTAADAWVLASIEPGGSTLTELLTKADGVNHARLLEGELTAALPRLLTAGLIGVSPAADRCWYTPAGHALYERAMRGRGAFAWPEALLPALTRLGPPVDATWSLPPGRFATAAKEAQALLHAAARGATRRRRT
jgi:hypothetical protein